MTSKNERFADLAHGMAVIDAEVRLHYVTAGEGERTLVLMHGFPQTWWEWRNVITRFAQAGFRVVAPDYRGAGQSSRPLSGYDKRTMAGDIHALLRDHLSISGPVALIGHDIGLMVAYAFAQRYRDEVSHLTVMDAPLPGTDIFRRMRADRRVWQFAFHSVRDIPEMLIAGRERLYIEAIVNARIYNPAAIRSVDLDVYASAYAQPGAMRAGLELYRAFDVDMSDNEASIKLSGKLKIPVLAVGGEISTFGPLMEDMMREVADDVTSYRAPRTSHFIAEENPEEFAEALLQFLA